MTLISQTHAPDEQYAAARAQFSEEEFVKLTMAVIAINGWNRLAIAFRPEAGNYQPRAKAKEHVFPRRSPMRSLQYGLLQCTVLYIRLHASAE